MIQSSQEWLYLEKPPTSLLLPPIFTAKVNNLSQCKHQNKARQQTLPNI